MTNKKYIILSNQGYTFSPNNDSTEPDIDNIQVLGFAEASTPKVAFEKFCKENEHIKSLGYSKVKLYELASLEGAEYIM